jgi:hypothetical protein
MVDLGAFEVQDPMAPSVENFTLTLLNLLPGTVVGTDQATDLDGFALSFTIVGGNGGLLLPNFAINASTGVITVVNPTAVVRALLAGPIDLKVRVAVVGDPTRTITNDVIISAGVL